MRSQGDRGCCGGPTDVRCAGDIVQRLSEERVRELAEEIWTASIGSAAPIHLNLDPRNSWPGASAQAAYQRLHKQERAAWRVRWRRRAGLAAAVAIGGGLLIGLNLGAVFGWGMAVLLAMLIGWRLRFRPSARARAWHGQAVLQRRTASVLQSLEYEGYLVLHDITLPGWPAGLDHLVVGSTGIWVIESWQPARVGLSRKGRSPLRGRSAATGVVRRLRWQVAALADAMAAGPSIPVRPLVCVHTGRWSRSRGPIEGVVVAIPRQLGDTVRHASPLPSRDAERATDRLLEMLRPAA
jgi:hypothetical protein